MSGSSRRRFLLAAATSTALALALPPVVLGHTVTEKYAAPLPLVAYVAGAALAVAMSFVFVSLRQRSKPVSVGARPARDVSRLIRWPLRTLGLLGWAWIMVQAFFGGNDPAGDVGQILLWIYGWIGLALISALLGPIWAWLDPFSTMHILLVGAGRRLGLLSTPDPDEDSGGGQREYPARLGRWPAVIGFVVLIWLELVIFVTGGRTLALILLAYTLFTLAGMALFGRPAWRRHVEVFSVWFTLLGRIAPYRLEGEPEDNRVARRPFASGLFADAWSREELVLVTIATASIIFDGFSQTRLYFDLIGHIDVMPAVVINTIALASWFTIVLAIVLAVSRRIGVDALGAGLLPVAIGYLIAHYFMTLIFDGQRIIIALNDPLVSGASLLPYPLSNVSQPWIFLSASIVWTIQLGAVVGGHVVGAWAGHAALAERSEGARLANQLPLAVLMVAFTSLTLWSLGQAALVQPTPQAGTDRSPIATSVTPP